jgi:FMN-binding domain
MPMPGPHLRTVLALVGTLAATLGLVLAKSATATMTREAGATAELTGPPIAVTHGVVQVRVTMRGGRIEDVSALRLPGDNPDSRRRSSIAAVLLRTEVLAAQSARVDAISGATYTSKAYLRSVQAVIDSVGG